MKDELLEIHKLIGMALDAANTLLNEHKEIIESVLESVIYNLQEYSIKPKLISCHLLRRPIALNLEAFL